MTEARRRLGPGPPGPLIRRLREHHGLTQLELAAMAGYHPNTVRKAESSGAVNWQTVYDLFSALGYELHIEAKRQRWEEPYGNTTTKTQIKTHRATVRL